MLNLTLTNDSIINNDPEHYVRSIQFSFATLSIGIVTTDETILDCAIGDVPSFIFNLSTFGVPNIDEGPFNFTGTLKYVSGDNCTRTYLTKMFTFQYFYNTSQGTNGTLSGVSLTPPSTTIGSYPIEVIVPLFVIGIALAIRKRKSFRLSPHSNG
jgi:hypothetical protein